MNISVEHAALQLSLRPSELRICRHLGRGEDAGTIARALGVKRVTLYARLGRLRRRTRMSLLSLAVFGYALLGDRANAAESAQLDTTEEKPSAA